MVFHLKYCTECDTNPAYENGLLMKPICLCHSQNELQRGSVSTSYNFRKITLIFNLSIWKELRQAHVQQWTSYSSNDGDDGLTELSERNRS